MRRGAEHRTKPEDVCASCFHVPKTCVAAPTERSRTTSASNESAGIIGERDRDRVSRQFGTLLAKRKRTQIDGGRRDLGRTSGYAVKKCGALVECAEFLTLSEAVAISARRRGARNRGRGSDALPIAVYARDLAREQRKRQAQPNNSFHEVRQLTCVMKASGLEALATLSFRSIRAAMSPQS